MENNLVKVYAAYRSGCLGDNILDTYFRFFANIIYDQHWEEIDEAVLAEHFSERYGISLPLPFIRQVLGVGMDNKSIIDDHGRYIAQRERIKEFRFEATDFDRRWDKMRSEFGYFCKKEQIELSGINVDERILSSLETLDEKIVAGDELICDEGSDIFDFAWKKFLVFASQKKQDSYDFIACISASNIMKQAIFFADTGDSTFNGLNVYLDSPMVFAILGMDMPARVESCRQLVEKAQAAGCCVQVFDHIFQEIEGIVLRAAGWARSPDYSVDKANNVARYFHDSDMDKHALAEYCEGLEDMLADRDITIKQTVYDLTDADFQEDTGKLNAMIQQRYQEQGQTISEEKQRSIEVDVRSIIMVYRERRGQTSTRIQTSREIMLTLNGTVANVSKNYESNQSINAGHIPACISADLFGAVLWLFSPVEFANYQKKQLLADCYGALRPNKKLLTQYVESLRMARNAGEIDEKKFLFMRSHSVVYDALMNVTRGDYARFNERTYREVFDEIQEKAAQQYKDEVEAHKHTKETLGHSNSEKDIKIEELSAKLKAMEDAAEKDIKSRARVWGWVYTICFAGLPYVLLLTVMEILKLIYFNTTWLGWIAAGAAVVIAIILAALFEIIKKWLFICAEKHLRNRIKKNEGKQ